MKRYCAARNLGNLAIAVLSAVLAGCGNFQAVPEQTSVASRVELPIDLPFHNFPAVEVRESHDPDRRIFALVDTGGAATLISSRFVERNKIPVSYSSISLTDALGRRRDHVRVVRIDQLKIGDVAFSKFDAIVDDDGVINSFSDRIDIILGATAFNDVLLTIDYPHRRLELEKGILPAPDNKEILPLKQTDQHHLLMPANVLGEQAWLLVDTGHTGEGVLLSRYRLLGMRWASTPVEGYTAKSLFGLSRARIGRMDGDIGVGAYSIRRPIVGISVNDDVEMIGGDVLKHFSVTFDQKNSRIRLHAPSADPIESPPVRRLGFTANNRGEVVLEPGTEAARAGLKDGDRLLAINGITTDRFTRPFIDGLTSESRAMVVRIQRADQTIDLTVPVTTIIP